MQLENHDELEIPYSVSERAEIAYYSLCDRGRFSLTESGSPRSRSENADKQSLVSNWQTMGMETSFLVHSLPHFASVDNNNPVFLDAHIIYYIECPNPPTVLASSILRLMSYGCEWPASRESGKEVDVHAAR